MEKLQPKLRFPEFKGDWKKKNIGEITNVTTGGTPSTLNKEYWNGNIRWMNSGDLNFKRVFEVHNRITELGLKKSSTKYIPKNSILIGLAGQGKTRGTVAMNMVELCINQSIGAIFPNNELFFSDFLYHNLDNRYDELRGLSTGDGGRGGLNLSIIKNLDVKLPSLPEQTRIANFLSSVDEKLNLLKEKRALLEEYKNGIMQKIFNQEIRFKDDNGNDFEDWEDKKLGDYKELIHGDGNWILSKDLSIEGKYKLIQLGNIGFGNYVEKELKTISLDKFNEIKGTLLNKGDLLINRMVDNNLYCCILDKDGDYITSVDVCWIRKNNLFNNYFLMSILLFEENQVKLLNLSSGSGRVRISKSNLFNEFKFLMPDLKEQAKIANFLSAIDEKIELVSNQIQDTQEYKKGLLQQMFI